MLSKMLAEIVNPLPDNSGEYILTPGSKSTSTNECIWPEVTGKKDHVDI